jgi:hypothetical protein
MPVANAIALPWVACSESARIYPLSREEHPMPETKTILSMSISSLSMARSVALSTMPLPHPAHRIDGIMPFLRYFSASSSFDIT